MTDSIRASLISSSMLSIASDIVHGKLENKRMRHVQTTRYEKQSKRQHSLHTDPKPTFPQVWEGELGKIE